MPTVSTSVEYEFNAIVDFYVEGMTLQAESPQKLCETTIHVNHNNTRQIQIPLKSNLVSGILPFWTFPIFASFIEAEV